MALSDYTGMSPQNRDRDDRVISRVAQHHQWDISDDARDDCIHCGSELQLHERHLLVTLSDGPVRTGGDRYYLCNEHCLREWVDVE